MVKVNEILMNISLHVFTSVFDEWKRKTVECFDTGGDYRSIDQPI
jgi:hypothetical protein